MPYTILIVDDDRIFRNEFRELLDDYEVVEAESGEQALQILGKPHQIDLVMLDVMMPGLRGTEVLRRIKEMEPRLSIIILTGHSSKDVAVDALKGRADDYIEKPFSVAKAKEIINRLLDAKSGDDDVSSLDMRGKIEKTKRYIDRNCYKRVELQDAAEAVCLSAKYLSRIFKQVTGVSFSKYRLGRKIEKAKELLRESGMNVSQISAKLAYENTESFIRQFKKLSGKTPTEYRRAKKSPRRSRKKRRK